MSPPARRPARGSGSSDTSQTSRGGQVSLPPTLPRAWRWPWNLPGPHQLGPPPVPGEPARSRYLDVRRVLAKHRSHGSAYGLESPKHRPWVRPQASVRDRSAARQTASRYRKPRASCTGAGRAGGDAPGRGRSGHVRLRPLAPAPASARGVARPVPCSQPGSLFFFCRRKKGWESACSDNWLMLYKLVKPGLGRRGPDVTDAQD